MRKNRLSLLAAAMLAATCSLAAHAGVNAVDVPRITNGGTGYHGLTGSAGMPAERYQPMRSTGPVTAGYATRAGEASTLVDGRPNASPEADAIVLHRSARSTPADTRAMGAGSMGWSPASHASWGTPD
jgi:hypothetical protein